MNLWKKGTSSAAGWLGPIDPYQSDLTLVRGEPPFFPAAIGVPGGFEPHWGGAFSHCGELFQGPVHRPDGKVVTALITLPDPYFRAIAAVWPAAGGMIDCPPNLRKVRKAVELTLQHFNMNYLGCAIRISHNIPMGVGNGSSTCQCVAAVRAVLRMIGRSLTDIEILRLVYQAEGPCDPLTAVNWGVTLVWASRDGIALEVIPQPLPQLAVLGFVTDLEPICTEQLAERTVYDENEVDAAERILDMARTGIRSNSASKLAAAATLSAAANQHRCPIKHFDELERIAEQNHAAGIAVSHSGTAAAILWANGSAQSIAEYMREAYGRLALLGVSHVHAFETGTGGAGMPWGRGSR